MSGKADAVGVDELVKVLRILQEERDRALGKFRVMRETWVDLGRRYDASQRDLNRARDRARIADFKHKKTLVANAELRAEVRKLKRRREAG